MRPSPTPAKGSTTNSLLKVSREPLGGTEVEIGNAETPRLSADQTKLGAMEPCFDLGPGNRGRGEANKGLPRFYYLGSPWQL